MKIKIIDLLNKIAKGEEVPKEIRYKGDCWHLKQNYTNTLPYYSNGYNKDNLFTGEEEEYFSQSLNDEIEIIEDKKDEEIEIYINGEKVDITDILEPLKQGEYFYKENGKWYVHKLKNVLFVIEKDKKIENIKVKSTFTRNQKKIARKINEIIDKLNKEEE